MMYRDFEMNVEVNVIKGGGPNLGRAIGCIGSSVLV